MKKLFLISLLLVFVSITATSFATEADYNNLFVSENNENVNAEEEIYAAFSSISDVSAYIIENGDVSYSDLQVSNFPLDSLDDDSALAFFPEEEEDNNRFFFTKQTAFLMGCVFGLPGILAVAIVNRDDNKSLNSSIWGCVTSGCVYGGIVVAYYVGIFTLFMSY